MLKQVDMVEAKIPAEIEVLYPHWRYGGTRPGKYKPWKGCRLNDDRIWGWVPHPDLRRGLDTKACQRAMKRYRKRCYRPPGNKWRNDCVPVRIWTGRRYRWFWTVTNPDILALSTGDRANG